ncbi:hypothetical protein [Tsukamurella sp. NPDC003166]|uniref:hypothetical protein n=1 Tax=Tsukamurella sp. NPDC003166 TaxID=3154444 RepID=UPI0033BEFC96
MTDQTPTEPRPDEPAGPAPQPATKIIAPPFWDRLPKTIPHTRARTSTVIFSVLFIGLLWWYLTLYDEFVPKDVQQGRQPVATTTAPAYTEPAYTPPLTSERRESPSAAPSSVPESGSGHPSASGAPSSTVPGGSVEPRTAPSGGPTVSQTPSGGIVLPGGATIPLPVPGGQNTEVPTSGGAPTTTVPPS